MAQRDKTAAADELGMADLLERAYNTTTETIRTIPPTKLEAPSPCVGWTVRDVGNHLRYVPDESVVESVTKFQSHGAERDLRAEGMFGPAQQTVTHASPFHALLGFLGRQT